MAKFINNTRPAQIARRAAASGLSLPGIAAALHKVSALAPAIGGNFGPNGRTVAAGFLRELAESPMWNPPNGHAWVEMTPTHLVFSEVDSRTAALRQNRWELDPSGNFFAHAGEIDEEAGDRYRQQFEQQGFLLFTGVRQQTAQALGVPCDNSFHWAFDTVVQDFWQYHR